MRRQAPQSYTIVVSFRRAHNSQRTEILDNKKRYSEKLRCPKIESKIMRKECQVMRRKVYRRLFVVAILCIVSITINSICSHQNQNENISRRISTIPHQQMNQSLVKMLKKPPFEIVKHQWHNRGSQVPNYPFKNPMAYRLEPNYSCRDKPNHLVLALVHSSPYHVSRRKMIRQTWGNTSVPYKHVHIKLLFLFGITHDVLLQNAILNEHRSYGDILQGEFTDSYFNLSFNSMVGFQWIKDKCSNCELVIKVDDDVVIDTYTLISKIIFPYAEKKKRVFCSYHETKIFRDRRSKHYVSEKYFKGKKKYPSHCEGKVVMMTKDVIPLLHSKSLTTPFFFIEDVYFYGLVLNSLQDISITQMVWNKDFQLKTDRAVNCLTMKQKKCSVWIAGTESEEDIAHLWTLFHQRGMLERKI